MDAQVTTIVSATETLSTPTPTPSVIYDQNVYSQKLGLLHFRTCSSTISRNFLENNQNETSRTKQMPF